MILGDGTEVRMGNTYGQGEVGDKRGSKEMDQCPLTLSALRIWHPVMVQRVGECMYGPGENVGEERRI
jgi:hypothetical protein